MTSIARNHLPLAATISLLAILAIASVLFLAIPAVALGQTNDPQVRPTGLTGTVAHDQVALSWDNPGDATITGYQILRRNKDVDDPGVFHVHVDSTGSAATSYVDSDVEVETRYTYRIKAINAHGKSPRSSYFNANTPAAPPPPEPETPDPPTRPTGLTNTVTHDSVFLSWDDPNDDSITGYRILRLNRAEDSPGEFHVHVASTGTAATSYTDSDVEPETRYVYRIHALNTGGKSPRSGYTNADTPAAPAAPIPAAPTNLLTASTHNQVRINWSDPDDDSIIGYRVLRGPDADNLATLVDDTNSASASYTDDSVDAETTYVYALQARNSSGDSDRSETVEVTTQQAPDEPTPERSTHGVCGRTTAVRDAIVAAVSGVTDCGDVTTTHLEDITTLNLFRKNIASLQSGDFDGLTGLTTLDLGRNSLETLPASIFDGLTALTTLSLNRNSLESLRADVFDSLTALTTLNLEDNALETLPADVFESPTALTALDISSNSLTTLPANVFNQLTALTTLDLARNDLESRLMAGAFNGLTALTSLDLHGNSLDNLPADVFDGLTALTTLELYSNALETLPADVFDGLTALTTLNLSSNSLESLPLDVFDGLTALTTLELDRNALETLPAGVFDGLTALKSLRLYNNDLATLPAGVFDGLTVLESLTLDTNDLETLPPGIFEDLTALLRLSLDANTGSATFIPTANAGADQLVEIGTNVTLDGSASSGGPWGTNITYSWVKTSGADVTLDDADTATATFTAPSANTDLVFTLAVTGRGLDDDDNPYTTTATARVDVRTDITIPALQTATVNAASLELTYDEDLDASSVPAAGAYMVTVNGATRNLAATSPISIAGPVVTLTLATPVEYDYTVTLDYTVPDNNPVQDMGPNSAPGFMDQEVTNNTITAPGALADLVAVAGNEEVLLIWQAPTSGGQVESYEYRYAQGSTIPPVTTWNDAGTATRFIVTSLTNEQLHTFEVRAKNRSANGSAASVTETPVEIPLPVVSLSQTTYTVREGPNASVTVTINVSNLSTREIRVRVRTAAGTATTPLDFTNVLDTVTFVPGQNPQTSQTRRIPIQNDQIYEHEETFTVQLARIQGSPNFTIPDGMGEATVTIEDDEAIPTLQIADASAAEGGVITFTIQYKQITQGCINAVASSVDWAATIESGDTASADDLTIADSTLSLSRCRLSRTFTVQTTQDIIDETHETFTITLSNPVNAQLDDDPTATGTILDDDDAPSGPTNLEASVGDTRTTLSWDSSTTAGTQPITHHEYRSRTNITDYGDDWTPIPDSVPTGNNATSYRITGLDNQTTYTFQVRAINAAGPSAHATSNEVTPIPAIIEFVEMTQSVAEDAVNVQITLKASHPPASRITVSLSHTAPESGRAADVDDYRQGPSTIAFPPNSVEQNLNLIVTEDQKVEGTESFIIHIHSAPGATIGDQSSIRVDILDNDVGLISFFKEQAATPEGDPIHLRVDLTCPNPVMGTGCDFYEDLTIFYTIAAVTATQDDDYTLPDPLEVLIPAGEDIATIVIPTVDDEIDDDDETFTVTLSRTSSPLYPPHTGGGRTSTVTIRDNDTRGVTVHPTELHVPETRNATYTVVLDTEPTGNVTVTPSLAADGDQDITLQSTAALTFTPDNWRQPQSVQVNAADDIDEVNGQRVINHTVAGADYASEPGPTVTAKEVDDEINIPSTGAPSITGTPQVGSTLTADTSGIEDEDGNTKAEAGDTGFAYTYRWIQVDSDHETTIAGAESKTYVPVPDDAGKTLKVAVSFTDDGDNAEGPLNSGPTTEVLASRPSAVTDLAAEFGDARVALTWTRASNGGSPVTKHSYRLKIGDNAYRNWTDIPDSAEDGNNNTSYTVGGLNNNTTYTFQVRAVNAEGIGPEATSNEVTTLPSTIQFERSTVSVVENNEGVHVCLMASHPPSRQISIELRYAGAPEEGTAIPGVDFLPEPERFEYPANRDRACDDVPIIKDGLVERAIENFFIYLVDAPGAVIGENASLEVSILDIETATVEIAPQSTATEGSPLSFTITLSQPFTLAPLDEGLTVTYTTEHGTTQGDDYTTPDPLEFLIPTGATTATLEIPTTPDHVDEDDETFTVTLTTTSHQRFNILETATTANATILDNDTAGVSLSRQRMLINEGRSSTYSVVLTSRPSTDVTIEIAGQTTHITLDKHTLTFIPDDWNKAQTVTVRGALEDETTNLTHTATSGDADYQGVSIASLQVEVIGLFLTLEAPADQGAVRAGQRAYYSIRMGGTSEPLDEWVSTSMDYRWRGGGIVSHVKQAIEGSLDLDADGNKFTWTSYTVVPENHTGGALTVALRMEDEYEIGDPPSVCIDIIDANGRLRECSEPTGEPRIWAESELVQEGQEPLRFKVVLEHRSEQTVTVNYETFNIVEAGQDHTALAGEDYTAKNGTLTFQPGELEKIVLVTVLTDDIEENEEYVGFRLSNFSGARPRQGWVEIVGAIIDPGT